MTQHWALSWTEPKHTGLTQAGQYRHIRFVRSFSLRHRTMYEMLDSLEVPIRPHLVPPKWYRVQTKDLVDLFIHLVGLASSQSSSVWFLIFLLGPAAVVSEESADPALCAVRASRCLRPFAWTRIGRSSGREVALRISASRG
jgi:hypothetical protein